MKIILPVYYEVVDALFVVDTLPCTLGKYLLFTGTGEV